MTFYDTCVDAERAKSHFLLFKHFARSYKALTFDQFAKLLITEFEEEYPDFVVLTKIALIIPVSSAPCERGFSVQNALKTKVRNRLNPGRLNRLMFINLQDLILSSLILLQLQGCLHMELKAGYKELSFNHGLPF